MKCNMCKKQDAEFITIREKIYLCFGCKTERLAKIIDSTKLDDYFKSSDELCEECQIKFEKLVENNYLQEL